MLTCTRTSKIYQRFELGQQESFVFREQDSCTCDKVEQVFALTMLARTEWKLWGTTEAGASYPDKDTDGQGFISPCCAWTDVVRSHMLHLRLLDLGRYHLLFRESKP